MTRARSKRTPAQPAGPPTTPQYPPYRAVLAPITPALQAAHDRLSEAHGRACLALMVAEQEWAARTAESAEEAAG